ncbi:MAG: ethanolamine utilization microcompartment protein EutL [Deltaproteobacteria bacterium]|nr:ethanolamine utilization microcompartment protein EutL [Deltaproteobacteria bacterium]
MILDPLRPEVPAARVIPNVAPDLARRLELPDGRTSLGLLTCTSDDCLFAALDEGTKCADVEVVYARSFYAGAAHSSGPFSGEAIGLLAGPTPEEATSGLQATIRYLRERACFFAANDEGTLAFFPHVVPSVGRYLAKRAGVPVGAALAYLIAPPIEALLGLDAALKEAQVELRVFYGPPSETNYGGGLLTGEQTACEAAAQAFQGAVLELARRPRQIAVDDARVAGLAGTLAARAAGARSAGGRAEPDAPDGKRFRMYGTGETLDAKPALLTHLFDDRSLVRKDHPIIRLRGKLDLLQAHLLDAQLAARSEELADIDAALGEALDWLRRLLAAEVLAKPCPELALAGFDADELHRISHRTQDYLGVGFLLPDASMGPTAVKLNLLRAYVREAELTAVDVFAAETHVAPENRERMLAGLNRLSNAVYVLTCKVVAARRTG